MRGRPLSGVLALCAALAAGGCLESPSEGDGVPTPPDAGVPIPPDAGVPTPPDGGFLDCPGNLAGNPSFETGTAGWIPIFATAGRIEGGLDGTFAAEICWDGTSDDEQYYSFDDNPQTVEEPKTGERYRVSAWVRTGEGGPVLVELSIREFDEEGGAHPQGASVTPDDVWQPVISDLTVESAAPQSVDVYVASTTLVAGYCFHLDALCVQKLE